MIIHHIPFFFPKIFKEVTWNRDRKVNKIYLTFDDGPVPGVTDFVLDLLRRRGMKATFFMVGDNVRKHPQLAKAVRDQGHGVGNHTFHHVNGFKTADALYLEEIKACQEIIQEILDMEVKLFRPPYGRIKKSQFKQIDASMELVMWDVLTGDYDQRQSPEKCLEKAIKYTRNGSVIVFHDQQKSFPILKSMLDDYLSYLQDAGFETALL